MHPKAEHRRRRRAILAGALGILAVLAQAPGVVAKTAPVTTFTPQAIAASAQANTVVPPTVTAQPDIGVVAAAGDSTSFTAAADGAPAPTVQWQVAGDRDGPWTDIAGATDTTLSITSSASNLGNAYRAVFTNPGGTAVSRPAKLVAKTDWMGDLGNDIGNVPIPELTIPGSHDTGTYALSGDGDLGLDNDSSCPDDAICQEYNQTQSRTITQQLNDGIRYFDLRVCGNGTLPTSPNPPDFVAISSDPVTCHSLVAAPMGQVLFQASAFAGDHPNELVILDINRLYEVNPDSLASQIEQAFALPGGGSLLIPPQYCTHGDATSGTCAGDLTLNEIHQQGNANVIVNIENDNAPGSLACLDYCGTPSAEFFYKQKTLGADFYDAHPLLWGRPQDGDLHSFAVCTRAGAMASCFGHSDDRFTVLAQAVGAINTRQTFAEQSVGSMFQHFFVQFLQTTPTGEDELDPTGSLLDMAVDPTSGSNQVVGPGILGCGQWNIYDCFAQYRPENVNILAENYYERTVSSSGSPFDFVREIINFDEYARTAPVITVTPTSAPAATGWYNAAALGGQGATLGVDVSASDYRYPTGIAALECDDAVSPRALADVQTTDSSESADFTLGDGVHLIDCVATDGASRGLHGIGNHGSGGPGSTATPVHLLVDATPPVINCPTAADSQLILNQPISALTAGVSDATSGVASDTASAPISTSSVGSFTSTLTATDRAGNTATATCHYTVSYKVAALYDVTKLWTSGSVVPIRIELQDYYGRDVSAKSIAVTAKTVTDTGTAATSVPTSPGTTNRNMIFYVSPIKGYEYDLKTRTYQGGSYTLDFIAGRDPLTHHTAFQIH